MDTNSDLSCGPYDLSLPRYMNICTLFDHASSFFAAMGESVMLSSVRATPKVASPLTEACRGHDTTRTQCDKKQQFATMFLRASCARRNSLSVHEMRSEASVGVRSNCCKLLRFVARRRRPWGANESG